MDILNDFSSLFVNYYTEYNKFTELYGDNVIILHQTGHFYEIYDYPYNDGFLCSDIYKVSNIVNLNVTRRDKSKELSPKNWLMSGVPLIKLDKYCDIFLQNNYHVIVISQTSAPPNPEREVTHILSPGTTLTEFNHNIIENNLMSIFIEKNIFNHKTHYSAGISIINVSTGKSKITNVIQNAEDENYTQNEIKRIISYYNPVEIIVHTKDFSLEKENFINIYDLNHDNIYFNLFTNESEFTQNSYQNDLLQKVFKFNSINTPIEELNLEMKNEVLLSYIYLLNFVYQHKSNLIENIDKPDELNDNNYLILSADSVRQLNVLNNYSFYTGRNKDLFSLLNKTVTQIGKRTYKNRLLYPCLNSSKINERYEIIDILLQNKLYDGIRLNLKRINDYEKSLRKMSLDILSTNEFYSDYICYEFLKKTIQIVKSDPKLSEKYIHFKSFFDSFDDYYLFVENTFNFSNFSSYIGCSTIEKSLFNKDIYSDIDELTCKIDSIQEKYKYICEQLTKIIDPKAKTDFIKLEFSDKYNWFLHCTRNRSKTISNYLQMKNKISIKDSSGNKIFCFTKDNLVFKTKDNSNVILDNKYINNLSNDLIQSNKELNTLNTKYWKQTIKGIYDKYNDCLKNINTFIGDIDCHSNNAFISIKYNYYKPEIQNKYNEKSYFNAESIRHPISEEINKDTTYIENNIDLGIPEKDGILLYGMNSGGKSTLSKAVALSIIMAQSGCYVPCKSFIYYPYTQVFTRILSNDKLWSGLSSFQVEVLEMKHILNHANKNSLVIGDEVFNSSEFESAISLVNGCVQILHDLQCSFIFCTHLHELMALQDMNELFTKNLKVYHLQVRVENNILIFDRILKTGSGPKSYGIMVAESLGLFKDVISIANKTKIVLNNESQNILRNKKSVYNSTIILDKCKFPGCCRNATDTHHINEQKDSDENGNIGSFHKNNSHNLIQLCKEHHDQITFGNLRIKGYIETSEGKKVDYEYIKFNEKKKKKFNNSEQSIIKDYYESNKTIKKKDILNKLLIEKNIQIGIQSFNKIITHSY